MGTEQRGRIPASQPLSFTIRRLAVPLLLAVMLSYTDASAPRTNCTMARGDVFPFSMVRVQGSMRAHKTPAGYKPVILCVQIDELSTSCHYQLNLISLLHGLKRQDGCVRAPSETMFRLSKQPDGTISDNGRTVSTACIA